MAGSAPHLETLPQRRNRESVWRRGVLRLAGRLLTPAVVYCSLWVAVSLRHFAFGLRYQVLGIVACLSCLAVFNGLGVNRSRWRTTNFLNLGSVLAAWGLTFVLLLVLGYVTKTSSGFSRLALGAWFVLTSLLLCLMHLSVWAVLGWRRKRGLGISYAVVGPMTEVASRFANAVLKDPSLGICVLGYFDDAPHPAMQGLAHLGPLRSLVQYVRQVSVDAVYVSLEHPDDPRLPGVLEGLYTCAAAVRLIPNLFAFDLLQSEVQSVGGIPVMAVDSDALGSSGLLFKRGMDILISGVALIFAAPLMAVIALAIKLDSPGPIIFRQLRYGLNGDEIEVWKFRSMHSTENNREHLRQARPGDVRVTRVGAWIRRTSLDELPQLWNVLCGRMSLVGPRPHAIAHNELYRDKIRGYMLRHRVRPGMTGWAQVNGLRGETDTLEKMQRRIDYDLEYVRRWSPLLDLWILARTIPALLWNRDVY